MSDQPQLPIRTEYPTDPKYLLSYLFPTDGEIVVGTGFCSGIGFATLDLLLALGTHVHVWDINDEVGKELPGMFQDRRGKVTYTSVDVTNPDACKAAADALPTGNTSLYGLVTSAGLAVPDTADDPERFDLMRKVNVGGTKNAIDAVLPRMRQQSYGGSIVCMGSIVALEHCPNTGKPIKLKDRKHYSDTKIAVLKMALEYAKAELESGVRVNTVCPGRVMTDLVAGWLGEADDPKTAFLNGNATQGSGKMLTPDHVAREIVHLLTSGRTGCLGDASEGWLLDWQADPENMPSTFAGFRDWVLQAHPELDGKI